MTIGLCLQGTQPLYDRRYLGPVLDAFQEHDLAPTGSGLDERDDDPYTRAGALALLYDVPEPFLQTHLFLKRKRPARFEAMLALWDAACVHCTLERAPTTAGPSFFAFAETLADRFQPDWGGVSFDLGLRDDPKRPFANDDERDAYLLAEAGDLAPIDYNRDGPHGLTVRTYLGPFFAEQLGRARIETLPLVVVARPWGGYRVDLVPAPWAAEPRALVDAWRRGMAHLAPAAVFATPEMAPTSVRHWRLGAAARLRD